MEQAQINFNFPVSEQSFTTETNEMFGSYGASFSSKENNCVAP